MTDDLLSRLTAVVDEVERVAKRAAFGWGATWTAETDRAEEWSVVHASGKRDMVGCEDEDVIAHIAAWSPDVALRVVEWGRGVLERHKRTDDWACNYCEVDAGRGPCFDQADVLAFLLPGSVTE